MGLYQETYGHGYLDKRMDFNAMVEPKWGYGLRRENMDLPLLFLSTMIPHEQFKIYLDFGHTNPPQMGIASTE